MNDFFKVTPRKRSVRLKAKKGVIYNNPASWKKLVFHLGTLVVFFSIGFLGYIYQPLILDWVKYKQIDQNEVIEVVNKLEDETKPKEESKPEIITEEPIIYNNFDIKIPKIGAESKVIKDVSPLDKKEYINILKENVIAQSNISSLPGVGKGSSIYLFAHSSQQGVQMARNNSVFYLLGELVDKDVIIINYNGKDYVYEVYMKKVIKANETEFLNYTDNNKEVLILQTCWPIGTNWKRLLVFAERI